MQDSLSNQLDSENTHVAHMLFQKYGVQGQINRSGISKMMNDVYGNTGAYHNISNNTDAIE